MLRRPWLQSGPLYYLLTQWWRHGGELSPHGRETLEIGAVSFRGRHV